MALDLACQESLSEDECADGGRSSTPPVTTPVTHIPTPLKEEDLDQLEALRTKCWENYSIDGRLLPFRDVLIPYIVDMCERLRLRTATCHFAVRYFDRVLAKGVLGRGVQAQLVCCAEACVLVAVKFYEMENKVHDTLEDMEGRVRRGGAPFVMREITDMERYVLNLTKWELAVLTPLSFLGFFLSISAQYEPGETLDGRYLVSSPMDDLEESRELVEFSCSRTKGFAEMFVSLCLKDYDLTQNHPYVIAASAVCAARRACKIFPEWPERLQRFAELAPGDLEPCVDPMWRIYKTEYPQEEVLHNSPVDVRTAGSLFY